MSANPKALVLLAAGAEEMEVVITVDVLRRGGVDVVVAGLAAGDAATVRCSRDVAILPDRALHAEDLDAAWDAVVLPGGLGGARALADDVRVGDLLKNQLAAGRFVAAICAAPIALVKHGVLAGQRVTSHPSVRDEIAPHGDYVNEPVVSDGPLLTSRGPGTAFEFALALVGKLQDEATAAALRDPMML